ncbi:pao retrotransposon peptidase domain-containing protein [Phthorimaea operculella]|nr:pao retrotransposon peptidase domain-containing protein [Phthorimaea operculella]
MADIAALVSARGYVKGQITRLHKFLETPEFEKASASLLQTKKELLVSTFKDYVSYNMKIALVKPDDAEDAGKQEEKYCETLARINDEIDAKKKASGAEGVHAPMAHTKLPNIEIPTFTEFLQKKAMALESVDGNGARPVRASVNVAVEETPQQRQCPFWLKPKHSSTEIVGVGNVTSTSKYSIPLEVFSLHSNYKVNVNCKVVDEITCKLPQQKFPRFKLPANIELADDTYNQPSNIDMILAGNIFLQSILRIVPQHELLAGDGADLPPALRIISTQFGDVLGGDLTLSTPSQQHKVALLCTTCDSSISKTVKKFWQTEEVPQIFNENATESELCEDIFKKSVQLKDQRFQVDLPLKNILWRENPNTEIKCIQLTTVQFGLKSSSFLATRCLDELASIYKEELPLASFILKNCTFVDDILYAESDVDKMVEAKKQLVELLKRGGFQTHKWASNSSQVLQDIPQNEQHFDNIDFEKQNYSLRALGINYNVKEDCFTVSCPEKFGDRAITKREILSYVTKFYDPLGFISPIIVTAKSFIQTLWAANINWDSPLTGDLKEKWVKFAKNLDNMAPITLKRSVSIAHAHTIELVGFADASSTTAYGCCIYLRLIHEGKASLYLLCSKSRVNPLKKPLTVPRLELNAALLLAKLMVKVHEAISTKTNVHFVRLFCDSKIVLAWIRTQVTQLNAYVANRVQVVTQLTAEWTWHYIPTSDNPADLITRGVSPQELGDSALWWSGPSFLQNDKYEYSRPKWRDEVQNVKVGDLVLLRDDGVPPLMWPMGRITKLFPGTDDKVRAFEVMTPNRKKHCVKSLKVFAIKSLRRNSSRTNKTKTTVHNTSATSHSVRVPQDRNKNIYSGP